MPSPLTIKEAVGYLRSKGYPVCADTIRKWCNNKVPRKRSRLRHHRVGGRIYINPSVLDSLLPAAHE